MSMLYGKAAELLRGWNGEDAAARTDPRIISKEIVDMVVSEIQRNGFASFEQLAAHDGPSQG